jgi:hypothetical protein
MAAFIEVETVRDGCFSIRVDRIDEISSTEVPFLESRVDRCKLCLTNDAELILEETYQDFVHRLMQIARCISILE